jgi:hypothetical protein
MLHDPRMESYAGRLNPRLSFRNSESRGSEDTSYRVRRNPPEGF